MAITGNKGALNTLTVNSDLYQKAYSRDLANLWPMGSFATIQDKWETRTELQSEYKHTEDNARFRISDSLAAALGAADVEMTVTTDTKFIDQDVWIIDDGTNREHVRINGSPSGAVIPIQRNLDGGGAHAFAAGRLIWVGPANTDGGSRPQAFSTLPDKTTNYIQKHRLAWELTSWQDIAAMVYGKERTRVDKNKFIEYVNAISMSGLYGVKAQGMDGGELWQTSAGVISQVGTNNIIVTSSVIGGSNASLSEKELLAFFDISSDGPNGIIRQAVCAPWILNQINYFGHVQQQTKPGDNKYGVNIKYLETTSQTYQLIGDNLLNNYGSTNRYDIYGSYIVVIPEGYTKCVKLGEEGRQNIDIVDHRKLDAGSHKITGEYWTSRGWEVTQESLYSILYGATGTE